MRLLLPGLTLLKAGFGLNGGARVIEINPGEIEMAVVEAGLETRNFGTEPARDVAITVHRDANLTLLDDGMNLNRSESVGAQADMHLSRSLRIGVDVTRKSGGIGGGSRGRRGVKHLVSLR